LEIFLGEELRLFAFPGHRYVLIGQYSLGPMLTSVGDVDHHNKGAMQGRGGMTKQIPTDEEVAIWSFEHSRLSGAALMTGQPPHAMEVPIG
jgi:hypothetical protein